MTTPTTGKTISLYLAPGILPAIQKLRSERGETDLSEAACVREAKDQALKGIQQRLQHTSELQHVYYLVNGWQALSNHAEAFMPELLNNPRWIALKRSLEERTDELGVTAFIHQVVEHYLDHIEQTEVEDEG